MKAILLFLIGVLLLSGCCGQFQSAYEQALASDRVVKCESGGEMSFFDCAYVKAEGRTVHVSLESSLVREIHSINSSGVISGGAYFPQSYRNLESSAELAFVSGALSGNMNVSPESLGAQAFNCTLSDYMIENRTLNMTYLCDTEIPASAPTTYFLFLYMPVVTDADVTVGFGFNFCSFHENYSECEVKMQIAAERR